MGNKLYVGNLPYSVRDGDLEQSFSQFGAVTSAKVMMERDTGRSKGFGFVEMGSEAEAQAAIEALNALKRRCVVDLYTDSQYVRQGITEWLAGWKRKHWKTASGAPVKNQDLWEALDAAVQAHEVRWHWVKGHAGHPENERADQLANQGIDELKSL